MASFDQHNYDEKAAARILAISPKTLSRWRKAGLVSHFRTPTGRIRYKLDDLLRIQRAGHVAADTSVSSNGRLCPQMAACVTSTETADTPTMAA